MSWKIINLLPLSLLQCFTQEIYCCVKFQRRVSSVPRVFSVWNPELKEGPRRTGVSRCWWAERTEHGEAGRKSLTMPTAPFMLMWRRRTEWRAENKRTEMPCFGRTSDLQLLPILTVFLVAGKFEWSSEEWQENGWWETWCQPFLSFLCLSYGAIQDKHSHRCGGWGCSQIRFTLLTLFSSLPYLFYFVSNYSILIYMICLTPHFLISLWPPFLNKAE